MEIEKLQVRVKEIRHETPDANTYVLEEVNGKRIEYKTGQFLTLLLTINGVDVRRSYSFSSSPGIDIDASITIKKVINGSVSRYLLSHIKVGAILHALPPAGKFLAVQTHPVLCFIVAGSGVTPSFSIIKQVLHYHADQRIILLYQNRNEALSIFRNELLALAIQFKDRFKLVEMFSEPAEFTHSHQRLNNYLLESLIIQYVGSGKATFYLCGPAAFMRMAAFTLKVMGYANEDIKKEIFAIDAIPPPAVLVDTTPRVVTILQKETSLTFEVVYPQNILQAALAKNIQLPYSCRGGICSTCSLKKVSGEVVMSKNEVLTVDDVSQGWILTCVAYTLTDVVLIVE